jgi:hypothetical protein
MPPNLRETTWPLPAPIEWAGGYHNKMPPSNSSRTPGELSVYCCAQRRGRKQLDPKQEQKFLAVTSANVDVPKLDLCYSASALTPTHRRRNCDLPRDPV